MLLQEISQYLNLDFVGDGGTEISSPMSINEVSSCGISFVRDKSFLKNLENTTPGAIILKKEFVDDTTDFNCIFSDDPERTFIDVVNLFHKEESEEHFISKNCSFDSSTSIGENCRIDDFVVIGKNSKIGDNCFIMSNVNIHKDVIIGDNAVIYPNVTIYKGTVIGHNCVIHSGVVIGSDGFGYIFRDGERVKVPQVGNVIIGNDVEIGANTTIDRATLDSTIIGDNTKIDNLVQIAHNCHIGKSCTISAQVGFSGHTIIEDNCMIAGQVGFAGHQRVQKNTIIRAQSGVAGNIKENSDIMGTPAKDFKVFRRELMNFSRVGRLIERVKKLENDIKEIK